MAAAAGVNAGPQYERGRAMLERVGAEVHAVTFDGDVVQGVLAELSLSLRLREQAVRDDHDPRYLHTARTIRILVADAECGDDVVLQAAARMDSVDAALEPADPPRDEAVRMLLAATPRPRDAEPLIEALLCAPAEAVLLAAAERLDHARHLHLRDELDWLDFHRQVTDVYAPVALRVAPRIGHRLDRWADAFRRRLLRQ